MFRLGGIISAAAAQTLGMALHELGVNASKYGALSNADGRVTIEWTLQSAGVQEGSFEISWQEQGGPAIAPRSRKGFGSTVISEMAQFSLNAKVDLDYAPSGLTWRLKCNAAEVLEWIHP